MQEFSPDWFSPPGDTIADVLAERNLSFDEFAQLMGYSQEKAKALLHGHTTITIAIARRLDRMLGGSVGFWMSRDYQYWQDADKYNVENRGWIRGLPIADMIKFGWLNQSTFQSNQVMSCLHYFGVSNITAWRAKYLGLLGSVDFRTSPSFNSDPGPVAAWLRQGEIEAEAIKCHAWNEKRFSECLSQVRPLTRQKDPRRFILELRKRCAKCGVAVAIVRSPNGCRASGATSFITRDKALLMLSFRYLSDDQFWFTFFHEAGHLLLHGKEDFFLEGLTTASKNKKEQEANDFAVRTLIPLELRSALFDLPLHWREVVRFAGRVGVSPGIVVGQLQYYKRIPFSQWNHLKRRFRWAD